MSDAFQTIPDDDAFTLAILANGERPVEKGLVLLTSVDVLVACDGALLAARACGREPDFVVGDGDSLSDDEKTQLGRRFVLDAEQETNDFAKAFRFIRRRYPDHRRVVVLGAGGGREDHLIDNVFRLAVFARELPGIALVTNHGRFDVVHGVRAFDGRPGDSVSVFAPTRPTHVTSEGLNWPLAGVDLSDLYAGVHNRTTSARFVLQSDQPLLVYRPFRFSSP